MDNSMDTGRVLSRNYSYDVYFKDRNGKQHTAIHISDTRISNAVNFALSVENLTYSDVEPGSIVVIKEGYYSYMFPNGKIKRQEVSKQYRVLPDRTIREERLTAAKWGPISRWAKIANTPDGAKKIEREVAVINRQNEFARLRH